MAFSEFYRIIYDFVKDNQGKKISMEERKKYFAHIDRVIRVEQDEMEKHRKRVELLQELRWNVQGLDYEGYKDYLVWHS